MRYLTPTFLWLLHLESIYVLASAIHPTPKSASTHQTSLIPRQEDLSLDCFPSLVAPPGLRNTTRNSAPERELQSWWCDPSTEQGFLGFSFYVEQCPSLDALRSDFQRMRTEFNARYVRLYGACDDPDFYDRIIEVAHDVGMGIYALVWFGFEGTDQWKGRMNRLIDTVRTNQLAPYVIRSIDVGSEPLFDYVLTPNQLAEQVAYVKSQVAEYGIQVSISEMQYGYTVQGDAQAILDEIDAVHTNLLPFFAQDASTPDNAWPTIERDLDWLHDRTSGTRKLILTQTGWPSNTAVWGPNSPNAEASVDAERGYAELLDARCEYMKARYPFGGVGWFWQIWSDESLPGWGVVTSIDGPAKFEFAPRTAC